MNLNIRYEIYDPPGIIVVQAHGDITLNDLLEHIDELAKDPLYRDDLDKLIDLGQIDSIELHLEDEEQLVNHKMVKGIRERRVAFIAADDTCFGLGRMYQALAEQLHSEVSVFRTIDAALDWLGISFDLKEHSNSNFAAN